jgi:radical SAM protein with 4Fe4S-binding SPASM domain
MPMDTLSYGTFSESYQIRWSKLRVPLNGTIEITRRCPLTCLHCYNNLPMNDGGARERELDYHEHCRLLDQLADAGCLWLLYTGGEIFARRDFLDIYTYAKKKGFIITLFTNGTMITESIADHLVEWRPFAIEITLYGLTKDTYERLTGIPGSFEKCMRGIHLLRERGLPLALKTVAVTTNRHEIPEMKRFVEEELGVPFKFDSMINPRVDCSQSPLDVRLAPEECVALDLADPKRSDEWIQFAELVRRAIEAKPVLDHVYQCGGGVSSFAVDPYGHLSICVLSEAHKYDIRAGSFREGWEGFLHEQRTRKTTRPTKCVACTLKSVCGMCPANGELENGDPEAPVDWLRRVAHLRARALDIGAATEYCEGGGTPTSSTRRSAAAERAHIRSAAADGHAGRKSLPARRQCARSRRLRVVRHALEQRSRQWTRHSPRTGKRTPKSLTSSRRFRRSRCGPTKPSSAAARRQASPGRLSTGARCPPIAARRCRNHLRRWNWVLTGAAYETFLSVGDVTFRVASDDHRLATPADGPLQPFFADHGRADVEISARWTDTPLESAGPLIFDSGGTWQLFQPDGDFLFTFHRPRLAALQTTPLQSSVTAGGFNCSGVISISLPTRFPGSAATNC